MNPLLGDFFYLSGIQLLIFIFLWALSLFFTRASWVDFYWSSSIGIWSVAFLIQKNAWQDFPKLIFSLLILFWSLRLSYHLLKRLLKNKSEDRRYLEAKTKAGRSWPLSSFVIFVLNAILAGLLSLPNLIALHAPTIEIDFWFLVGVFISLVAIGFENLADKQLAKHLALYPGTTLQSGLWKYSRHPNYFFEWLFWLGLALSVLKLPFGYFGLLPPVLMYIFLNYLTGVQLSEKNASKRRPDFIAYKEKTSAFFLWPPKTK